ncbi:H-NS family nucleoid-associated regulatory protein [Paraburkholderia sp. EG287B]|uniref:H-NS family nucleoid-associated regulatory protein n=1 Tax=Paraburkholderia sp. EG287B TaxID=3237010 RepID=UPI0034D32B8E
MGAKVNECGNSRRDIFGSHSVSTSRMSKGKPPAKSLDPRTGATWSGRDGDPAWITEAKNRARFLTKRWYSR